MLYQRTEDYQNFRFPWVGSSPTMKTSDRSKQLYYPLPWSSPVQMTPQMLSREDQKVCRKIQFTQSSPKKLFRPWTDDEETEMTNDMQRIECSDRMRFISSSNLSDQFNLKVQQLTETLTTSQGDDDHSKTTLEIIATNLGKSADGHRCIYCGKIYSRKYGLKIHLRTHTGFKPLKCKICNRPFGDPSNLNKHTRLHAESGAPLFQCHLCGKTLVRKRDLERHLSSRHPENDEIDVEHV